MNQIQTQKFIENTISLRRMVDLDQENITTLNLLILMMKGRSEKYPGRDAFSTALNHAGAMRNYLGMAGYGCQILVEHRFKYIHSDYFSMPGYLDEVLDLMDQSLFHSIFTEETLQEAKYLLENRLLNQQEDADTKAVLEVLKITSDKPLPIRIPLSGYMEDIDRITLQDVKDLHQKISAMPYQILTVGNLEERVQNYLNTIPQTIWPFKPTALVPWQPIQHKTIYKDVTLSALAQIYKTNTGPKAKDSYALLVLNSILGQCPMSLLFEEVRERSSYCYSISSGLIRFDGALLITTGCSRENMEEVKRLIAIQIERCKTGDFSDKLLESAKLDLCDGLTSQIDSDTSLISQAFLNTLLNRPMEIPELIEAVKKVTKRDVMNVAAKLELIAWVQVLEEHVSENDLQNEDNHQDEDDDIQ